VKKFLEFLSQLARRLRPLFKHPPKMAVKREENPRPTCGAGRIGIAISSGHGLMVPGAVGMLDEVREARRVVKRVAERLREMGVTAHEFHDDESATAAGNIAAIVGWHNSLERDLDVSVHFNAFKPTGGPRGTEVLYLAAGEAAAKVSKAISEAGGLRDRGARRRADLGFLSRAGKPAILLEVCFVDSAWDAQLYGENFDAICLAIADALRDCPKGT